MVLVTLGGCHLLDDLVARGSIEACKEIVRCSGEVICERFGAYLTGIVKSNPIGVCH